MLYARSVRDTMAPLQLQPFTFLPISWLDIPVVERRGRGMESHPLRCRVYGPVPAHHAHVSLSPCGILVLVQGGDSLKL